MTSSTSQLTSDRRSLGRSFFRRSDCLKLTHIPFFEECETRELVDGCMKAKITAFGVFKCTVVLLKRSERGGRGGVTLQLKPL